MPIPDAHSKSREDTLDIYPHTGAFRGNLEAQFDLNMQGFGLCVEKTHLDSEGMCNLHPEKIKDLSGILTTFLL